LNEIELFERSKIFYQQRKKGMNVDPREEIGRHLSKTDDPTLLILRAHLLVEERLRDVLARILPVA
jgi:hypothetical protein